MKKRRKEIMTKTEAVKELKERAGLKNQNEARNAINALGEIILEHITDEDGFTPFPGIKFYTRHRNPRNGRNPSTGESIVIEAGYLPKVKFGKAVKDAVNAAVANAE